MNNESSYHRMVLRTLFELTNNTEAHEYFHYVIILRELYRRRHMEHCNFNVIFEMGIKKSLDYLVTLELVSKAEFILGYGEKTQERTIGYRANLSKIKKINDYFSNEV